MANINDYATGGFLRPDDIKLLQEKTAEIIDEGVVEEDTPFGRPILEIPIRLSDGKEKLYGCNKTSANNLMQTFGADTKAWIGKKISFELVRQSVQGQIKDVIFAHPL